MSNGQIAKILAIKRRKASFLSQPVKEWRACILQTHLD